MFYFFYGQDTYRSREELEKVIEEHKNANPDWLDFVIIDAEESNEDFFEKMRVSVDTVSMFSPKKLIIIKNIFFLDELMQKKIINFLKERKTAESSSVDIIFLAEKIEQKNELLKFIESRAKTKQSEPLRGQGLKNWIRDRVYKNRGEIENSAIDRLINYIGSDLWRMSNELDKLLNYNKSIKLENIELLVKPEIDLNIFEMVDALGCKNKGLALKLFNQHLKKGEDEGRLFNMFVYQFRNLIKVKTGGGRELRPFVFKKTQSQAKNFSLEDLKKTYQKLLEIDLNTKTGRVDIRAALELFATNL